MGKVLQQTKEYTSTAGKKKEKKRKAPDWNFPGSGG